MQIEPIQDAFRYLFITGKALLIFDGLDELMETADRYEIKLAVERFVDQYQAVPIFVTSREVGYEQAPLDSTKFEVFRLEPFTDDQVSSYSHKWFSLNRDPILDKGGVRAKAFFRDSALVPDLRQNPLILSLLCSLYKQDGYLPSNRPEVYQRCADLLFEKWDKSRGILVSLPIEKKLRPAMGHLAHWIYADKTLQAGVSENALVRETARYLGRWCADGEDALDTAKQFVSFFKGRAWVFSDTGSSKSQPLYGFTHNTFLEFFTAEYLVKNHGTAKSLRDYLLPRLLAREWDVVCQLSYQMYSEMRSAADELCLELLDAAEPYTLNEKLRLASFLARTLDFIFPSRIVRITAITVCLQLIVETLETSRDENTNSLAVETFAALGSSGRDMLHLHTEEVVKFFEQYLAGEAGEAFKVQALLIIDLLDSFAKTVEAPSETAQRKDWLGAKAELTKATMQLRQDLIAKHSSLAKSSWWVRIIDLREVVRLHGLKSVFFGYPDPLFSWSRAEIAGYVLFVCLHKEDHEWLQSDAENLRDLIVASNQHPDQIREGNLETEFWGWGGPEVNWPDSPKVRDLALLMTTSAVYEGLPSSGPMFIDVQNIRDAKKDKTKRAAATEILYARNFSPEAAQIIIRWWDI